VALDLLDRGVLDQRPDLHVGVGADTDRERVDRADEGLDECVVDAVLDEDPVRGDARLAGVAELAEDRACDRLVQLRVVEDDERRVPAELERDLLQPLRALRHQQLSDLSRSCEAELADERVRGHLAADLGRTLGVGGDDRQHSFGQARLVGEHAQRERREGRLLGRLQHHRAAGGERRRGLARDHRRREVPGGDPGGDPDRLLEDEDPAVR
jgi:hypothetical protein